MRSLASKAVVGAVVVIGAAACSSSDTRKRAPVADSGADTSPEGTGGASSGGSSGSGGAVGNGGVTGTGGVVASGGASGRDGGEDASADAAEAGFVCPTRIDGGDAGGVLACADLPVQMRFDPATKQIRFELPPGAHPIASATVSLSWSAFLEAGFASGDVEPVNLSVVGNTLVAELPVPGGGIFQFQPLDLEVVDVCGVKSSIQDIVGKTDANPDGGPDVFSIHCER